MKTNSSLKLFRAAGILAALQLAGCQLPHQAADLPVEGPGAHYTQAAQTVAAILDQSEVTLQLPEHTSTPALDSGTASSSTPQFVIPSSTPEGAEESSTAPCDQVKFIKDVTIPDDMDLAPGEAFKKTWRIQNAGSCPWGLGYLLYFESGDIMSGPSSQDLTNKTIQPGESVDVSVDLVAPLETGTYQGYWKLRNVKGEGFGVGEASKPFWVRINVVEGAGMMFDFNVQASRAVWASGFGPVDYQNPGSAPLEFDQPGDPDDPYVALLDQQFLEGGRVSGVLLATYPPGGENGYIVGRFPAYKVNGGDLLFGRVGLVTDGSGNCGDGDARFVISLTVDEASENQTILLDWNEVCDNQMKSFELDLDDYKGQTVNLYLAVSANSDSRSNFAVWDSLSIHR